jgi:hypothetical protein
MKVSGYSYDSQNEYYDIAMDDGSTCTIRRFKGALYVNASLTTKQVGEIYDLIKDYDNKRVISRMWSDYIEKANHIAYNEWLLSHPDL